MLMALKLFFVFSFTQICAKNMEVALLSNSTMQEIMDSGDYVVSEGQSNYAPSPCLLNLIYVITTHALIIMEITPEVITL